MIPHSYFWLLSIKLASGVQTFDSCDATLLEANKYATMIIAVDYNTYTYDVISYFVNQNSLKRSLVNKGIIAKITMQLLQLRLRGSFKDVKENLTINFKWGLSCKTGCINFWSSFSFFTACLSLMVFMESCAKTGYNCVKVQPYFASKPSIF